MFCPIFNVCACPYYWSRLFQICAVAKLYKGYVVTKMPRSKESHLKRQYGLTGAELNLLCIAQRCQRADQPFSRLYDFDRHLSVVHEVMRNPQYRGDGLIAFGDNVVLGDSSPYVLQDTDSKMKFQGKTVSSRTSRSSSPVPSTSARCLTITSQGVRKDSFSRTDGSRLDQSRKEKVERKTAFTPPHWDVCHDQAPLDPAYDCSSIHIRKRTEMELGDKLVSQRSGPSDLLGEEAGRKVHKKKKKKSRREDEPAQSSEDVLGEPELVPVERSPDVGEDDVEKLDATNHLSRKEKRKRKKLKAAVDETPAAKGDPEPDEVVHFSPDGVQHRVHGEGRRSKGQSQTYPSGSDDEDHLEESRHCQTTVRNKLSMFEISLTSGFVKIEDQDRIECVGSEMFSQFLWDRVEASPFPWKAQDLIDLVTNDFGQEYVDAVAVRVETIVCASRCTAQLMLDTSTRLAGSITGTGAEGELSRLLTDTTGLSPDVDFLMDVAKSSLASNWSRPLPKIDGLGEPDLPTRAQIERVVSSVVRSTPPFDFDLVFGEAQAEMEHIHQGVVVDLVKLLLRTVIRTARECYFASVRYTERCEGPRPSRVLIDHLWVLRAIESIV